MVVDRAADALKQAEKLGYTMGDRETAQLADGYRAKGDSLWQTARQLADLPQESEYLRRHSFVFDLYILWLTLLKVVRGSGVSH